MPDLNQSEADKLIAILQDLKALSAKHNVSIIVPTQQRRPTTHVPQPDVLHVDYPSLVSSIRIRKNHV